MSENTAHGTLAIIASLIVALILTIIPIPEVLEAFRPAWVPMVVIYWVMALPQRIGVASGWIIGLFLDVASGALLGQNALALSLLAFLTLQLHQRIRVYPLGQQTLSILMFFPRLKRLFCWVRGRSCYHLETWRYWMSSLNRMLFGPMIFVV
ncbi:MAG: rod shape-determining protein MreD [Gammaproteobacteria bacterium]|nr:rod shape-determining protein MreD [Gammaproteobacteria bacterium]